MSTTVKTGWLKDKEGNKFAPKTLTSQVQTSDGILLEDKIKEDLSALEVVVTDKQDKIIGTSGQIVGFDEGGNAVAQDFTPSVQPDWNQTDETALDFIKNKPVEETEDNAMEMLFDMGIIVPAVDDGAILTDENGNILVI